MDRVWRAGFAGQIGSRGARVQEDLFLLFERCCSPPAHRRTSARTTASTLSISSHCRTMLEPSPGCSGDRRKRLDLFHLFALQKIVDSLFLPPDDPGRRCRHKDRMVVHDAYIDHAVGYLGVGRCPTPAVIAASASAFNACFSPLSSRTKRRDVLRAAGDCSPLPFSRSHRPRCRFDQGNGGRRRAPRM